MNRGPEREQWEPQKRRRPQYEISSPTPMWSPEAPEGSCYFSTAVPAAPVSVSPIDGFPFLDFAAPEQQRAAVASFEKYVNSEDDHIAIGTPANQAQRVHNLILKYNKFGYKHYAIFIMFLYRDYLGISKPKEVAKWEPLGQFFLSKEALDVLAILVEISALEINLAGIKFTDFLRYRYERTRVPGQVKIPNNQLLLIYCLLNKRTFLNKIGINKFSFIKQCDLSGTSLINIRDGEGYNLEPDEGDLEMYAASLKLLLIPPPVSPSTPNFVQRREAIIRGRCRTQEPESRRVCRDRSRSRS